jgi:hypothetical protein
VNLDEFLAQLTRGEDGFLSLWCICIVCEFP